MARERLSLINEEEKTKRTIESKVTAGEINAENFNELSEMEQEEVKNVLFQMASNKIDPNQGLSALEFVVFGFMRVMQKRLDGLTLSAEDKEVEESLQRIMDMHELSNSNIYKKDWLFDYLAYAEAKSHQFLENRREHIQRKSEVVGQL